MSPIIERKNKQPHMEIKQWLKTLELNEYENKFDKFNGVEVSVNDRKAEDKRKLPFIQLGILNSAHRARIISSLTILKQKYDKLEGEKLENKLQRHSVAIESGRLTIYDGG
ncbi:conserved hypothetical protein [Pediculus humanus corporis]|uniref:SAM domain-containing protein n=1 Tax=Pediculus humanus subsp. corporis TaxID=121224 RepID=E0VJN2_PEDHC|nr:uncharacterized protein Phum_PHUM248210 [Pediculus humanus corporis]EEB13588.1 conserved hypothetical protein [Pediculus humanus corporis]